MLWVSVFACCVALYGRRKNYWKKLHRKGYCAAVIVGTGSIAVSSAKCMGTDMNRYLKIALITTIVMAVLCAGGAFLLWNGSNIREKNIRETNKAELDLNQYGVAKEDISKDKAIPLRLSGEKKNVETFSYKNASAVYDTAHSKSVKEKLEKMQKKNDYTTDKPLAAYNPYGTNELSLYLYFELPDVASVQYTIHIENADMSDFNRTAVLKKSGSSSKGNGLHITGLVPDMENYIICKLYDRSGSQFKRLVYTITPPKVAKVQTQLIRTTGNSSATMTNGLYFMLGYDSENAKADKKIYIYDNSGILRGAIPLVNSRSGRIMFLNGMLFYNYSKNGFAAVNDMGQVETLYKIKGYTLENDFAYDGFGNIYAIATKNKTKTVEDQIISLNLEKGTTKSVLDCKSLFSGLRKKASRAKGASVLDWIGLNSIEWSSTDGLIVSARELSGIIKINYVTSRKPSVQYIIGDSDLWKELGYRKNLLSQYSETEENTEETEGGAADEAFHAHYGQSSVRVVESGENTTTAYSILLFNNCYGNTPTRKEIDWTAYSIAGRKGKKRDTSYIYQYAVDEEAGTYNLTKSFEVPYSTYESSVQLYRGNYVVNSATDGTIGEYDKDGTLIQELRCNLETYLYKVEKMDMKGFWYE